MSESPNTYTQNVSVEKQVRRRRFLGMGAGAALVAAVHPVASAMSKLNKQEEEGPDVLGVVETVTGAATASVRLADGSLTAVRLNPEGTNIPDFPSVVKVGDRVSILGSQVDGELVADEVNPVFDLVEASVVAPIRKGKLKTDGAELRFNGNSKRVVGSLPDGRLAPDVKPEDFAAGDRVWAMVQKNHASGVCDVVRFSRLQAV